MTDELKAIIESKGDRLEVVSIGRINALREEMAAFRKDAEMDGFHAWVVDKLHSYKTPDHARSVVIAATPHPAYANIVLTMNGKTYKLYGTVSSGSAEQRMKKTLEKMGYKAHTASRLPLKRLAVQSGLAEYGRNNITYVEGMGSFLALYAYYSDMPCEEDRWRDVTVSPRCESCELCLKNCPTGAIRGDRVLLEAWKCLSTMNEGTNDFPDWLPETAHHTPYDCLKCQACCPMNADCLDVIDLSFDEAETERVLAGAPYNDVSKELKRKINLLALDKWKSVPRNLRVLFDAMDKGHVPTL